MLQKGRTMHIMHALLMTAAEYDAVLIEEAVKNWDIHPVAEIICCRTTKQLQVT